MGSAVQSSPLTSTLTMRAFLTVFLAVAVCGEADPYTIGQVLTGHTAGGVITGVSYPGVGTVAGFPYAAVHHPFVYGKGEAEAEPEPYTVGQIAADITLLTLLLREGFTMLESSLTLPCTLSLPLSTTVWLDTPDIIPTSTARGRLRPSPSTVTPLELSLTCTTLVSTTVLLDIPDIIPTSTARGRLRPSPSTVTPPELSLTCTTLVSWLPLVSDTLSP